MTKKSVASCLHKELGDYLEVLRLTFPVDGKRLVIREVCALAAMSPCTYYKVKKESART